MAIEKSSIKEKLLQAAAQLEHGIAKAKHTLRQKFTHHDPIMIQPYHGYGNDTCVYLSGRVLEKEPIHEEKEETDNWEHLKNTYLRFESDETPGIRLKASYNGKEVETQTNEEGFFDVVFRFDQPIDYKSAGNKVHLQLLENKTQGDQRQAEGIIFTPHKEAEFGIISDIDDTVLVSNIDNLLKRLKLVLLNDAAERSPFPGVGAFLQALCTGCDERFSNPLFYVSSSEWNLFDFLVHFFSYHNIPEGPLFLRDKGGSTPKGQEFKRARIGHILETFPQLKFILLGDSGQHDPEIYWQVVEQYPERILGVYVRDVSAEDRDGEVTRITEEVRKKGIEMLLIPETLSAARHAHQMQWINEEQLKKVEADCKKDNKPK